MSKGDFTIHVEGFRELHTALRELPDATAKNVLRRIGRARLAPIAQQMADAAPKETGRLRASVKVSTKLTKRQRAQHQKYGRDDVEIFAGPGGFRYAHMAEFGTAQSKANPFVRPVWDSQGRQLLLDIQDDLWLEIKKAADRLARKAAKTRQ